MTVNGKEYKANEAYPLQPEESTNVPIDGYKVAGSSEVMKITNGYSTCSVKENDENGYTYEYHYPDPALYAIMEYWKGGLKDKSFLEEKHKANDRGWDAIFKK